QPARTHHGALWQGRRRSAKDRAAAESYAAALAKVAEGSAEAWTARERVEGAMACFPVWAVTSLSAGSRFPLARGLFDLVLIDEASQSDIASALPLLYRAKRAVVLGDPNQLTHITTVGAEVDAELA